MTWTMLTSLILLPIIFLIQFWSPVSSAGAPQAKPFFSQEVSRMGMPDRNSGALRPVGVARLGDVEPPRLPPLHGLHEGAFELGNVGHLPHHGASALRLLATHYLRFHVEDL